MLNRLSGPRLAGARLRSLLGGWLLLVLFLQGACTTSAPRAGLLVGYRYKSLAPSPAPRQSVTLTPPGDFGPIQVSATEWREAFTQLVLDVPLRVADRSARSREGYAVLASWPSGGSGDFRVDLPRGHRDRFALALGLALTPAVDAASGVLQDISAQAMPALLSGLSLYLHELRGASGRYAQVLGPNTLRILLLLATWKAGARGQEAMRGSGLPGFPQAVRNAAIAGRFHLPTAASEGTSVSVAEGRLVLTLPSGSSAFLAMQRDGEGEEGHIHHVATVENEKSPARGGPWTPRLKKFFDRAGMSMEDPANKVRIPGHKGPHPEAYHKEVFRRLGRAVKGCETTAQCRESLTRELE